MAQGLDFSKRRTWSERLRRFAGSDLTVAGFCDLEGVSTASFYEWRRRLTPRRASRSGPNDPSPGPSFLPLEVVSPAATSAPLEIHFPNGVRVSLITADQKFAMAAIAAAAQLPDSTRQREEVSC